MAAAARQQGGQLGIAAAAWCHRRQHCGGNLGGSVAATAGSALAARWRRAWPRQPPFCHHAPPHSSLVRLVLNVETGHISPQSHVIFDDKFETVNSLAVNQPLDRQWADIFWLGRECFLDIDYDANGLPILPLLSDIINLYSKAKAGLPNFESIQPLDFDNIHGKGSFMPPPPRDFFHNGQAVLPLATPTVTLTTLTPELLVPDDIVNVPSVPGLTVPGGVNNHLPSNASPDQDLTAQLDNLNVMLAHTRTALLRFVICPLMGNHMI